MNDAEGSARPDRSSLGYTAEMADLTLISYVIAIGGDALNTAGAFVLAWDVLGREREHKMIEAAVRFAKKLHAAGSLAGLEDDAELVAIRDAVRLGRRGCALIFLGFMLLILHRGLEIYELLKGSS